MVDYDIKKGNYNETIIEFTEYQKTGELRKGIPGDSLGHPYNIQEFIGYIKNNSDKFEKNYRRISHVSIEKGITYNFFPNGNVEPFKVTISDDIENFDMTNAMFQDIETALNMYNKKENRLHGIKKIGVGVAALATVGVLAFTGAYAFIDAAHGYNYDGAFNDTVDFYKNLGSAIVHGTSDDFKTTDEALNEMLEVNNLELQDGGTYKASRK